MEADLGRGRQELLNLSEKMTEREEEIGELMLKLEGLGKKKGDKDKDAYIERLEMRLGRGRDELLQKMTEKEEIIKGLETKLEGLEKMLESMAVHSADSGNTGCHRFHPRRMLPYLQFQWPLRILHQQH